MGKNKFNKGKLSRRNIWIVVFVSFSLTLIPIVFFIGQFYDSKPVIVKEVIKLDENYYEYLIDFEANRYLTNTSEISSEKSLSGNKCGKLHGLKAYSPGVNIPIPTNDTAKVDGLHVEYWINPTSKNVNFTLVFSVLDPNKNQIHWDGHVVNRNDLIKDNWQSLKHSFDFPLELISTGNTIKVYLWNKDDSDNVIFIDDVSICLNENVVDDKPRSVMIDFEDGKGDNLSSKYSWSGFYSASAEGVDGFSTNIEIDLENLECKDMSSISYSFHFLSEKPQIDAAFVMSIVDSLGNDVVWESTSLEFDNHQTEVWDIGNGKAFVPDEAIDPSNKIKMYLWNRNDNTIYIDDVYLLIDEKNGIQSDVDPAINLVNDEEYHKKTNKPPYELMYMNMNEFDLENDSEIHLIFTKTKKNLVGNFDIADDKSEILSFYKDESFLSSFKNGHLIKKKVEFEPAVSSSNLILSDQNFVFVGDRENNRFLHYENINGKFQMIGEISNVNIFKIIGVSYNQDKSVSVFRSNGEVSTYILSNDVYSFASTQKLIDNEFGNIKCIKGNFLGLNEQMLVIYLNGVKNAYKLFEFSTNAKLWQLSTLHSNKSSQGVDKIKFNDTYHLCNFDLNSNIELLKFSKSPKFDFKVLGINKMSYEILYDIDFVGYSENQNPKYYEVNKIICGDFVGDAKTEVIIFQDNLHKVEWLNQKVEMYSFE